MPDIPIPPLVDNLALGFTWFERNTAATGQRGALAWPDLCRWIADNAPTAPTKEALPLIKLATFANDHRSNGTIEAVHGIEGDYDAGTVQPADAAERLRAAGIEALVYTTPSHRPGAPRWRVLCPLSAAMPADQRHALVARLNGALGGILARESFTPAQPFYVGTVDGGEPMHCIRVSGAPLDTVTGIVPAGPVERAQQDRQPLGSMPAPSAMLAQEALFSIDPNDCDRTEWRNVSFAFRQAATGLADDATVRLIWDSWCAQYDRNSIADNHKLWRSADSGTELGWSYLLSKAAPEVRAKATFGQQPMQHVAPTGAGGAVVQVATAGAEYALPTGTTTGAPSHLDAVRHLMDWQVPIAFDLFAQQTIITAPLPSAPIIAQHYPRPLEDTDITTLQIAFNGMGLKVGKDTLHAALEFYARVKSFNPVCDYLSNLQWDGVARLDNWLAEYLNAEPSEWCSIIGPKFLIAMVARAFEPGIKFDTALVIEGKQGVGKSTALRIIAGDEYFGDHLPNMHDKEGLQYLSGLWLVEISELSAMRRSEVNEVRQFLSATCDRYRPPYAAREVVRPRTCVFAATTNDDEYLLDETGDRRFWPVSVGEVDIAALARDRDQLFAEAVQRYRAGEQLWLTKEQNKLAEREQDQRKVRDAWHDTIEQYCADLNGLPVTMAQLFTKLEIPTNMKHAGNARRIKAILTALGYRRKKSGSARFYTKGH